MSKFIKLMLQTITGVTQSDEGNAPVIKAVQGHPIAVNPMPNTLKTHERNILRVERCKLAMAKLEEKGKKQSREWKSFELELERRRLAIRHYELLNTPEGGNA